MDASLKKILRPLSLALRHELEGWRDENGSPHPGDLERRLAELGIHREKSKPLDEMPHLSGEDRRARVVVDGYLQLRADAGVERDVAVAEFVRESAYTWANRLLALRCMEARSIIEEVILQKAAYAGRSLVHHRFLRKYPDAAAGADDGLFVVLFAEFAARAAELPALFDSHAAAVALRPSVAALKRCVALLSGTETVRGQEPATDEVFSAPDAFGWAYQYWNTEEKDRVFEAVRTKKGTKIEGADIIPATQLYTEPYMVKFLVQNSLGALWMGLHPESRLCDHWEYYVRDADRAPAETPSGGRAVRDFTFLDPALGSGHFHLEAFDLLFAMYRDENPALTPREIAASILNRNLFGIDLDDRAVQIAEAALWMKGKDAAPELQAADLDTFHDHLVATNIRLPRGRDHLEAFLHQHPEDAPLRPALDLVFRGLEHADELGSLLQIEEPMERELRRLKAEADAAGTTPPMQPDMFRSTAVQSVLPMGVESYEAWKAGALDRLKAHFEQEAEAADPVRAFFGASARKGLALFDLFARRYDIVAANPPYMGSKNMNAAVRSYVDLHYEYGKRDLYSAFIYRARSLVVARGMIAMVTLASWLTKDSFTKLRSDFLRSTAIHSVALLGRYAFSEADPPGYPVLFILRNASPEPSHVVRALSIGRPSEAAEQAASLRNAVREKQTSKHGRQFSGIEQARFSALPNEVILVGLTPQLIALMVDGPHLEDALILCEPSTTGNNTRYVRFSWEVTHDARWVPMSKGGGHRRWRGLEIYCLDWHHGGARVKAEPGSYIRNERQMFVAGITFTAMSRHGISFRQMPAGMTFGKAGPGVLPKTRDATGFLALLNSRPYQLLLRNINPGASISLGNVARLPLVERSDRLRVIEKLRLGFAERDCEVDLLEGRYRGHSAQVGAHGLKAAVALTMVECLSNSGLSSAINHLIDGSAEQLLGLSTNSSDAVSAYYGQHPAALPLLRRKNTDLQTPELCGFPRELGELLEQRVHCELPEHELVTLSQRLRQLYDAGPSGSRETDDDEDVTDDESDEDDSQNAGAHLPNPAETFIEELSQKLELHPISVFWLLKEGIEQEGWRCLPEEKRLTEDRFTVLVLRMLGHRWLKQIEDGEPLPDWADHDGVIPISSGSGEPTLTARVLERLGGEFPGSDLAAIRAEFAEIVGAPLEAWLASGFFARHIPQFKKRPIAWQLQSQPAARPGRRRSAPARGPVFACLVYYHRLDADLLPKLRSHYLAVLRVAHETELRTLEALAQSTPDQGARKAELEVLVDELNSFDAKLQAVVESGFGPAPLQPRLRQLAVDDAMLAMKARWLARLRDTLQAAPLADWQTAATALGHHTDFPRWLAAAIAHLPHHCAKAGVESPDAAKLPEDPTPATLAAVICAETDAMTATALDHACAEWRHEWDTQVIDPLRAQISAANGALEALAAELESLDRKNFARAAEISQEQKRLRAEVKAWKRDIKDRTGQAGVLASRIRKWTSPELATWEPWLASTPLSDEVSSLDGHRAAPATIRDFIQQESLYSPDLNDGVRVNIAPLQRAGLLAADVLVAKDLDKAIADRAEWRADERRWVREGKVPQPGWWPASETEARP